MTIQVPQSPSVPQPSAGPPYAGSPWVEPDSWTSPLWGRPDTLAGYGPGDGPPAEPPPAPGPGAPPPPRSRRRLAVVAAVIALALVITGAVAAAALRSDGGTTAAPPRPSAVPSIPARPTQPQTQPSTPSGQGQLPGLGQLPGQGTGGQGSTLTPQQQAAVAAVSPGLVDIVTSIGYDGSQGAGTGIVLTSDGIVLTNHHVVAGSTKLRVTDIGNGQTYDATVLGYDRTHDLAVIRLQGASGLTVAPLGSSASVKVGNSVVAIGNAGGVGGTPSAVAGSVTALDQSITAQDESSGTAQRLNGLIAVDAAIQPGDSGGAIVDADGKVVGIITAGSVDRATGATSGTSGFAIPIDQARAVAQQIVAGQSSDTVHIGATAFLGIQVSSAAGSGSVQGVPVAGVVAGTAAERAGIAAGDVVTAVDGQQVATSEALATVLGTHKPGDTVTVRWTDSSGGAHSASVRLGSGPVG
jgi:S1-C subfamily serine protease